MFKSKTTLSHDFPPFTSGSLRYIQGLGILSYRILSTNAWHRSVMSGPKLWLLKIHWHWGSFWIHSLFKQGSFNFNDPWTSLPFFWGTWTPHVYMSSKPDILCWSFCFASPPWFVSVTSSHPLVIWPLQLLVPKSCPSCQGSKNMKKVVKPIASMYDIHPGSLTWNLKINPWKRRFLLETIIFRFHVKLWGCILYILYIALHVTIKNPPFM